MCSNKDLVESAMLQGIECRDKGDIVGAIAWLTKAISLDDTMADAYLERGKLLLAVGDKEGAEADMRQWLRLSPEQLNTITGDFQAKGTEQRSPRRPNSILNPYGI